jgi:hypothetical protein
LKIFHFTFVNFAAEDVMENVFRGDGIISDEGPSMHLETEATSAGTSDGVEVASEPRFRINSLCYNSVD